MKTTLPFLLLFFASCADLKHDNALDPKNPNGEADQIAVVENFVITNTKGTAEPPYVGFSQDALYELKGKYTDGMLILEYHMIPTDTAYRDSFALSENELRYANEYRGSALRGFPHAFFDGKQTSIQGASSKDVAKNRYETILDSVIVHKQKLFCEATKTWNGLTLTVNVQIVRYGDQSISNLIVEYIVYEDMGAYHNFTVRKILVPEPVTVIQPEEIKELEEKSVTVPAYYNTAQIGVVVLVKDAVSKAVLQAALAK